MIADIYTYQNSVSSAANMKFDLATIFIDIESGLLTTPILADIKIDNANSITMLFKGDPSLALVGQFVVLKNLREKPESIFSYDGNNIFCKVKSCNRLGGNVWQYELINMEWLRVDFFIKCDTKFYTEIGRIGYLYQNNLFVPEFVYPYSQDITKASNLIRYTKERRRLDELNTIARNFCSTQDVFHVSYTKNPSASVDKDVSVIQYLYCKFIPDVEDNGYSSISIGGSKIDPNNVIKFQVNNYDRGLTDTTENITTTIVIPFLTSENDDVQCYLKNPKSNVELAMPKLRNILGSPNLVSSFILPFAPFWASTTAAWKVVEGKDRVTFAMNNDNIQYLYDAKGVYQIGAMINTKINGGAGLHGVIDPNKLMDYVDSTHVDKNASVLFEFVGEKIPFTIELCERFKENYFEYITFEFMFSMDNLILRVMQFDGTFKDYALNSKYLLLTDAWQDYFAQNKNYKDTLYNIQRQTLDDQYRYERDRLEQQIEAEKRSVGGALDYLAGNAGSFVANVVKHFTGESSKNFSVNYDKYERPFDDLANSYSNQVIALKANYDATIDNIKNTPTTIENSIFPIDLLSQWQISVNVLKYPQQFFKVKWIYGTPSTENTLLQRSVNTDTSKLYPPQIVKSSQGISTPFFVPDQIASDFIRDYGKSGYLVFDNLAHIRNFATSLQII